MILKKSFKKFWRTLLHPRVIIFMLVGIGIIFLTFLTDDNALEIAISGMASVFIGIAVNNYSIVDTREEDNKQLKHKIRRSLEMMEICVSDLKRINSEEISGITQRYRDELANLQRCIELAIELIKEAGSIK